MNYEYLWSFGNPNDSLREFRSFGSLLKFRETADAVDAAAEVMVHEWGTSSLAKQVDLNHVVRDHVVKAFDFGFRDMERVQINKGNMLRFVLHFPVICCVIQLWIHWQAVKVYWKGISVKAHPRDKYVNPVTFWIKHVLIFVIGAIAIALSWTLFMIGSML